MSFSSPALRERKCGPTRHRFSITISSTLLVTAFRPGVESDVLSVNYIPRLDIFWWREFECIHPDEAWRVISSVHRYCFQFCLHKMARRRWLSGINWLKQSIHNFGTVMIAWATECGYGFFRDKEISGKIFSTRLSFGREGRKVIRKLDSYYFIPPFLHVYPVPSGYASVASISGCQALRGATQFPTFIVVIVLQAQDKDFLSADSPLFCFRIQAVDFRPSHMSPVEDVRGINADGQQRREKGGGELTR